MKEQRTPLLLVAYKRTDTLGHALSALAKCKGLNDRPVFAYLDGARSPADEAARAAHLAKYTPQALVDAYFSLMTHSKKKECSKCG